ncbi:hydrolase [Streptomyces sp. AJS327]|uniref:alpha/beta hydrolase family protein n=1 Tax=Streptomyces sp. AJS327 TaxID=2545265 RepID=UPI0015DDEB80|nr:alpha/beta family hydrolase [Streptomyces sp. AJS327]MBA0051499.1 hydrolase [Streptomyces sp. AJS327]
MSRGTSTETVSTPSGDARLTWHPASRPRAVLALGHGAGGGIEARDLRALAGALPGHGVTVALVEQPWRVAGNKVAPAPGTLDTAWTALWPRLAAAGPPVVAGGRSAGARVACRTAAGLGALAVLALAFPLHPPGKPGKSRAEELTGAAAELPVLVLQGERDPFGRPGEFPPGVPLTAVPGGDHGFAVPKRPKEGALSEEAALAVLTDAAADWITGLPGAG